MTAFKQQTSSFRINSKCPVTWNSKNISYVRVVSGDPDSIRKIRWRAIQDKLCQYVGCGVCVVVKYGTQGLYSGHHIQELREKPVPHITGSPTAGRDMLNWVQRAEAESAGRAVVRLVQGNSFIGKEITGKEFQVYSKFLGILISADISHCWVWWPRQTQKIHVQIFHLWVLDRTLTEVSFIPVGYSGLYQTRPGMFRPGWCLY